MSNNTTKTKKSEELKFENSQNFVCSQVFFAPKTFYDYTIEQDESNLWLDDYGWI